MISSTGHRETHPASSFFRSSSQLFPGYRVPGNLSNQSISGCTWFFLSLTRSPDYLSFVTVCGMWSTSPRINCSGYEIESLLSPVVFLAAASFGHFSLLMSFFPEDFPIYPFQIKEGRLRRTIFISILHNGLHTFIAIHESTTESKLRNLCGQNRDVTVDAIL
jgi:hypothetical protein